VKKVLIVRFSSIGDIILTTPIVRAAKKQMADAEVHYLTKNNFTFLLEDNPYIDKIYSIEKDVSELKSELKAEQYDFVIDLHKNLRTKKLRLILGLGVETFSFSKLNIQKWLYTSFKINVMPNIHIVDRYFKAVESLGVTKDNLGLDFFIPKIDEVDIDTFYIPEQFIVYVVGGQFATKRLPTNKIIELLRKTEHTIVLLGGVTDLSVAKEVTIACNNVINLCGDLNFNQSASVLKQCNKVITHDTGLMHVAAAFNKQIITIWGNTTPDLGMYPYSPNNSKNYSIHQVENLKCRPCSKIGYNSCPKKHFNCMNQQNLDEIISQIN